MVERVCIIVLAVVAMAIGGCYVKNFSSAVVDRTVSAGYDFGEGGWTGLTPGPYDDSEWSMYGL